VASRWLWCKGRIVKQADLRIPIAAPAAQRPPCGRRRARSCLAAAAWSAAVDPSLGHRGLATEREAAGAGRKETVHFPCATGKSW